MALLLASCSTVTPPAPDTQAIRTVLSTQIDDWNRGDIDRFMRGYWRDAQVRFASGGDVTRGFDTVLGNYKTRYPDRSAMGELRTTDLEITPLGSTAAMAFGRWIVTAGGEDYCGLFTLILRNIDDRWVIVHDHTSAPDGPMRDGRTCAQIKASSLPAR